MSESPPFRVLSTAEFRLLTPEQKVAYLAAAFRASMESDANATPSPPESPAASSTFESTVE